jgi:hypothetical protein
MTPIHPQKENSENIYNIKSLKKGVNLLKRWIPFN